MIGTRDRSSRDRSEGLMIHLVVEPCRQGTQGCVTNPSWHNLSRCFDVLFPVTESEDVEITNSSESPGVYKI